MDLISFPLFWNFPKIFGKAACLSNSFWVNDRKIFSMVKEVNNEFNEKNRLYIDCGTGEKELLGDYKKMITLIKSLSTTIKISLHHLVKEADILNMIGLRDYIFR